MWKHCILHTRKRFSRIILKKIACRKWKLHAYFLENVSLVSLFLEPCDVLLMIFWKMWTLTHGVLLKVHLNLKNMYLFYFWKNGNLTWEMLSFTCDFLKNLDLNNADFLCDFLKKMDLNLKNVDPNFPCMCLDYKKVFMM